MHANTCKKALSPFFNQLIIIKFLYRYPVKRVIYEAQMQAKILTEYTNTDKR